MENRAASPPRIPEVPLGDSRKERTEGSTTRADNYKRWRYFSREQWFLHAEHWLGETTAFTV